MKLYEKPMVEICELFEKDIITGSLDVYDDTGIWDEGWSSNGGGNA